MQKQRSKDPEKDCISKCDEAFVDCVERSRTDCLESFNKCSTTCQR